MPAPIGENRGCCVRSEIREILFVLEGELQRIEIVLEADYSQRPRLLDFFVTLDRGHGVRGGAETDVPENQRFFRC